MDRKTKQPWKNDKGYSNKDRQREDSGSIYGKIPPQAKDIEEAVLGAILLEKDKLIEVLDIIKEPECFYVEAHQRIFAAINRLVDQGKVVDILTVTEELNRSGDIEMVGGGYAIAKLTSSVSSSAHAVAHSMVLLEKYTQRELIRISGNIISSAYEDQDVFDLLQYAEDAIFDISIGKSGKDYRSIGKVGEDSLQHIISRIGNAGKLTGIPTGFPTLDSVTGGWQVSDLVILAAKSGLGKTAFLLNTLLASAEAGHPTALFSLEMSERQIHHRLLSIVSLIPLKKIKHADLNPEELEVLAKASKHIASLPLYIDDSSDLTAVEFRSKLRKMRQKEGIELVGADYLQLFKGQGQNREQEISYVSRMFKAAAKANDLTVIALSQTNDDGNLRESRAIEHNSNIVILLDRPDYKKMENEIDKSVANTAELKVVKNRDGELKEIALDTDLKTQRFFEPEIDVQTQAEYYNPQKSFQQRMPYKDNDDPPPF